MEAAKRVHDEAIGKGRIIHLFRFGEEFENQLHQTLQTFPPTEIESLCSSPDSTQTFLSTEFPGAASPSAVGPIQVGALSVASEPGISSILARHYQSGFAADSPVFPYLR